VFYASDDGAGRLRLARLGDHCTNAIGLRRRSSRLLFGDHVGQRSIRIFVPMLWSCVVHRRLDFVRFFRIERGWYRRQLRFLVMAICAVVEFLPERDVLSRSMRGFSVNIAAVFCQAQNLLFLWCPVFHDAPLNNISTAASTMRGNVGVRLTGGNPRHGPAPL
jgi:hypothetical protein